MNQSKLTFNEIIEQLKPLFGSVDDFAYDNGPCVPKDYEFQNKEFNTRWEEYGKLCKEEQDLYKIRNSQRFNKDRYDEICQIIKDNYYKIWKESLELYYKENSLNLEWETVHQKGGEGEGDEWYSVKYFPQHDVYIRVDGWYSSGNGTEFYGWECCTEVRPKEVLVTVYK